MLAFADDPCDQKQSKTAGHTDIGDVEHREIHKAEVDEVHHVAQGETIDGIAYPNPRTFLFGIDFKF